MLQSVLQQLQHQYRLMQQHQQQLRNQRQTVASPVTSISSSQVPAFNGTTASQTNGTPTAMPTPKLVQPSLQPPVPTCMSLPNASFNELDVSEEELQDLLSQKGLATTLAENLLKQFGSDEIDIKEESNLGKSAYLDLPQFGVHFCFIFQKAILYHRDHFHHRTRCTRNRGEGIRKMISRIGLDHRCTIAF